MDPIYHIDKEASVAGGGPGLEFVIRETIYEINGQKVTKEKWDAHCARLEGEVGSNMENQENNEEQRTREEKPQNEEQRCNVGEAHNDLSTLSFPIGNVPLRGPVPPMKNIPLTALPNVHGLTSEDLDEFLFEFDILCRIYDYTTAVQKLKLFPSTLKGNSLCWFMSLGGDTITTWEQMKQLFLQKYQDYYQTRKQ